MARATKKRKPAKKTSTAKAKKPATKARKKKSSAAQSEMLVVQSKFKECLKEFDVNVAGDAVEGMNKVLHWYLSQAAQRAQSNGRKTVRAHDFMVM